MIIKKFKAIDYHWSIWRLDETIYELMDMLPDRGAMYQQQLEEFTSESRKREWLAVRVLLFKMLNKQMQILYHKNGKPYLPGNEGNISISHTKGYVVVIYSNRHLVGIDIERVGDRILRVAHKFVTEAEIPVSTPQLSETEYLTMIWSAKEVMFKCMDTADVDFREHLFVDVNNAFVCQPYFPARETRTPIQQNFSICYMLQRGEFVMTWAFL